MADKYLIFGATYNGDGTSSSEAASNGAAGAWNQESILTGTAPTYGTLAAGDTVWIRSKTGAGADANISKTLSGSVTWGNAAATVTSPITWILDNGVKWSGKDGTLTFTQSTTNYGVTLRDYNNFISLTDYAWTVSTTYSSASSASALLTFGNQNTKGLCADAAVSASAGMKTLVASGKSGYHKNFKFRMGNRDFSGGLQFAGYQTVFENIDLDAAYSPSSSPTTKPILGDYSGNGQITFVGGFIHGAGATSGIPLVVPFSASGPPHMTGIGFSWPIAMCDVPAVYSPGSYAIRSPLSFSGVDGMVGALVVHNWGQVDSRNDGNYPTLNATLPDSANTKWSWKVNPYRGNTTGWVAIPVANKLYTDTAAAKTLTLEALIANTFSGLNKATMWIDVTYIDNSTGLPKLVSSQDFSAGALDTSTAAWSATTYGAITLVKNKFSVTTPTSIKQNTQVQVVLCSTIGGALASDIMFVDPDVQAS